VTEAVRCRLCAKPTAFWFSGAGRDVYRCPACRHVEVPAGLAMLADGRSIYESEDAVFTADGNAEYYLDDTNSLAAEQKLRYVRRFCDGGTLIDVGASYGHFLAPASAAFDARGFEVNGEAVEFSRRTFNVENMTGSLYAWPPALESPADVITCWDVIEHVEDPGAALRIMGAHLKPGGWLFLSTPDAGSWLARILGRRWHYLDPLQHINVFSRRNLAALVEANGLRVRNARTFGRTYRLSYVVNRLAYLHGSRRLRGSMAAVVQAAGPALRVKLPITLGDVMGMAIQRPVI
jgi:SAM-dependent methyltransferase